MKTKTALLLSLLTLCLNLSAQQVGHTSITFTDPTRSNRQIATEIYYPATSAGNNTPIANGTFPVIAFGHGFVMAWSAYQNFWDVLVPEGYIVAFPTTEGNISPNHSEFGKDLKFIITEIQNNGAGASIPVSSIGTTSAIMGHSMGGGSSFLAAENNSSITTMVSFAAANTNPSSITASQHISVPTLIFSGVNDCVAPPAQHQDLMYDSTSANYKTQVNITGGGHCYFANTNFNCSFGEGTCTPNPSVTRAEQQDVTNDLLTLWLGYYLKNDCQKAQDFQDSLLLSPRITYRQNLSIACITGVDAALVSSVQLNAFPNPFSDLLTIEIKNEVISSVHIYTATMQNAGEFFFSNKTEKTTVDLAGLTDGIYFMNVNNKYWKKVMKRSF